MQAQVPGIRIHLYSGDTNDLAERLDQGLLVFAVIAEAAELLEAVAGAIATEARAKYNAQSAKGDRGIYKGLTFWSPNVNIFRDPRWGRGHETYGEDPYLTGRLGVAYVKGLQGSGETMKAAACAMNLTRWSRQKICTRPICPRSRPWYKKRM